MPHEHPNVVFIIADQLKATALRMYSDIGIETPALERLAREGVRFENTVTPHPLCVPARTSMMTSRYPHSTGCRRNETLMPAGELHAFRIWKDLGYRTGFFGKNHCFIQRSDLELLDVRCEISHGGLPKADYLGEVAGTKGMDWVVPESVINESHATRRDMPDPNNTVSYAVTGHPLEGYSSAAIATQVESFLERHVAGDDFGASDGPSHGESRPFAIEVSFPDPHAPIEVPRKYADMFPPESITLPPTRDGEFDGPEVPERNRVCKQMLSTDDADEQTVREAIAVYMAMTRFVDDSIGQILDKLDALGLRDNTIVVFTADHGDFVGEHRMYGKAGVFYDSLVHVPMFVSWPGGDVPVGATEDAPANTIDLLPTILQLSGVADFTISPSLQAGQELASAGPRMICDTQSDVVNSESLRRLQGHPLPTATVASARPASFSEYGTGGELFTLKMLNDLPISRGTPAVMNSLWAREAEGRRRMVRTKQWKYVTDPMESHKPTPGESSARPEDELYDLANDPWELHNVAHEPGNLPVISEMRAHLADWMIETEEYNPVPLPTVIGRGKKPEVDTNQ